MAQLSIARWALKCIITVVVAALGPYSWQCAWELRHWLFARWALGCVVIVAVAILGLYRGVANGRSGILVASPPRAAPAVALPPQLRGDRGADGGACGRAPLWIGTLVARVAVEKRTWPLTHSQARVVSFLLSS